MGKKSGEPITLETFDLRSSRSTINSPRSLEACRAQGIEPEELLIKDEAYFRENMTPADADIPQYANRVCMHYESNRQVKLRIVREERLRIIQQQEVELAEMNAVMGKTGLPKLNGGGTNGDAMDPMEYTKAKIQAQLAQEKKAMEKQQQRQIRKIKNMVAYEIRKQQTKNSQMEQMRRQQERADALAKEKTMEIALKEQKMLEVQAERRRIAYEEELDLQRQNRLAFEHQQQMAIRMQEEAERKRREMQRKAQEREAKQMEKRRQLEAILRAQAAATQRKADELARRDEERTRTMAEQRAALAAKMKAIQERAEERTAAVQKKQVELLESQRLEFQRKEELVEERRQEFEYKREMENEARRLRGKKKEEELEQTKALADAILQTKRIKVMDSEKRTNDRLAERACTLERERLQRVLDEQERNIQRRAVLENAQQLQMNRAREITMKMHETNTRTQQHFAERSMKQKQHKLEVDLQQRDRMEHVERMRKMQAYRRGKLALKIQAEGERVAMIKSQWAVLAQRRAELRAQEAIQKQELAATFTRLTKLNAFDTMDADNPDFGALGIHIPGLSDNPRPPSVSRMNSARSTNSMGRRRHNNTDGDSTFMTTTPVPSRPNTDRPRTKTPRARRAQ